MTSVKSDSPMLSPLLLVGVGGSGGKTLRAMRQALLRVLRNAGWQKNDLPAAWQMLWIDAVTQQDEDAFDAPLLPDDQYTGLVTGGLGYGDLRFRLEIVVAKDEQTRALAGWMPADTPLQITMGAGQDRATGRVISAAQLQELSSALLKAHDRLSSVTATTELSEVAALLGEPDDTYSTTPFAIVISSVAGGSGSAMFLDVVEVLKCINPEFSRADNLITCLYTPDIFGSIGGSGGQLPPNSLATVTEVTAGVLASGLSHASKSLLAAHGLNPHSGHGFGATCNFLIGGSNRRVVLGSAEDAYSTVGESLTALALDGTLLRRLRTFVLPSVFLESGSPQATDDASLLSVSSDCDESMPFSALGMGRVSLGTDSLEEYAALLIGREITQQLLWPDFEPSKHSEDANRATEEIIAARVDQRWDEFLFASRLNERDSATDIVDGLADLDSREQRIAQWAREGFQQSSKEVGEEGITPSEWGQRLQNFYDNRITHLRAQEESKLYETAQNWTSAIQEHLLAVTSEAAIRNGLSVTARLVNRLIDEMQYVAQQLRTQSATKRAQTQMMASNVQQAINVGASHLPANNDAMANSIRIIQESVELEIDADRYEIAAGLVADLSANFLKPLHRELQLSRARLAESVNADALLDGRSNPWPTTPEFNEPVPIQLRPGSTKKDLIQPETYQKVLQQEVQFCLPNEQERHAWRSVLRERSALGQVLDTGVPKGQSLFVSKVRWVPDNSIVSAPRVSGVKAEFGLPGSFEEIRDHVARWFGNVDLAKDVSRFLKQGLVEYLASGTPEEQVQKQGDFLAAFQEIVHIAAPFVEINPAVRAALHPNVDDSLQALVSTIPFVEGDPLHDRVKQILIAGSLWSDQQSPKWFAPRNVSGISIFTMPKKAMMPMVFDNVMKPIATSWEMNARDPARRHAFWAARRARPLTEFIPAAPRQLQAMIRGWFLAGLFNQRVLQEQGSSGWRVQVWDPRTSALVDFPFPLLSVGTVSKSDLPAAVLISLALAMVEVNRSGTPDALRPYQRLIELGNEITYKSMIDNWISNASIADKAAPTPDAKVAGSAVQTPDERRETVLRILGKTRDLYAKEFAEVSDHGNPFVTPTVWELCDQLISALDDLYVAAESVAGDYGTL